MKRARGKAVGVTQGQDEQARKVGEGGYECASPALCPSFPAQCAWPDNAWKRHDIGEQARAELVGLAMARPDCSSSRSSSGSSVRERARELDSNAEGRKEGRSETFNLAFVLLCCLPVFLPVPDTRPSTALGP